MIIDQKNGFQDPLNEEAIIGYIKHYTSTRDSIKIIHGREFILKQCFILLADTLSIH